MKRFWFSLVVVVGIGLGWVSAQAGPSLFEQVLPSMLMGAAPTAATAGEVAIDSTGGTIYSSATGCSEIAVWLVDNEVNSVYVNVPRLHAAADWVTLSEQMAGLKFSSAGPGDKIKRVDSKAVSTTATIRWAVLAR